VAEPGKISRSFEVSRAARRGHLLRVLRELGVIGSTEATREGAVQFRQTLEELGTTFVKLGQLLSSRPDLLPDVYIDELGKLVDDVPPVPFAEIREVIGRELGLERFTWIDETPLASASIGHTHRALLDSGRDVVVKVRRPGVVEQVALDLALMRRTARIVERRCDTAKLLQLRAVADELEQHLQAELDFVEEAHNAELIAQVIDEYRDDLFVPRVIRPYVTPEVLVLERVEGVKVEAHPTLNPARAAELARSFFQAYVRQVTVEGVYHADPHHGNVLVTPDGRLALLDFGLIGRLDDDTRASLALLLLAVAQNRADDVADLILSLSLTTPESDEAGLVGTRARERERDDELGDVVRPVLGEREQQEREPGSRVLVEPPEQAEIEQRQPPVVGQQHVPVMRIGVVDALDHDLEDVGAKELAREVGSTLRLEPVCRLDLRACDQLEHQRALGHIGADDARNHEPVESLELVSHELRVVRLLNEVEFRAKMLLELVRELFELDPLRGLGAPGDEPNRRPQHREVELDLLDDPGTPHFGDDLLAGRQ